MNTTILDRLQQALTGAALHNRNVQVAPAAILWPDKERQWEAIAPLLRDVLPQFLVLGAYDPAARQGPAIWLKCMIARTLPEADWPEDAIPVIYLPGISRQELRAVNTCPKPLQPLAELQYRGVFWSQHNGKDWTVLAFLKSREGGLGLDVAQDARTQAAMTRSLLQLVDTPIEELSGRRLEAADFDRLLSTDPVRDLLRWLNDPAGTHAQWSPEQWSAFRAICKAEYGFDPQTEGELTGAERLGNRQGKWTSVWSRFEEAPRLYPNLPALLARAEPPAQDLFADRSAWPGSNEREEQELRKQLLALETLAPHQAAAELPRLEKHHGGRRNWVWARLGYAPLAQALEHLVILSQAAGQALGGAAIQDMAAHYAESGWRADAAMLAALACVERAEDVAAIRVALRAIYAPWLEGAAVRLQALVGQGTYPGHGRASPAQGDYQDGECILFFDGLRLDVGQLLKDQLEDRDFRVTLTPTWTALPSVTATGKAAVSPVAGQLAGTPEAADFQPAIAATGKPLSSYYFRQLLTDDGWQVLGKEEIGDPAGRAWCEYGDLDHYGHEHGWKLAWRVKEQLREVVERIDGLFTAGWRRVRIVTDHGWLLVPGGLPKAELPGYLAESRWGRCALLKPTSQTQGLVIPWRWSSDVQVAMAPGISCFKAGTEYAHGGLSLQECLTPVLTITRDTTPTQATLGEIEWRGLRLRMAVEGSGSGKTVDLRTRPADPGSSVTGGGKPVNETGKVSLVVEDDTLEGTAAVLVLVDAQGTVVAKRPTTIGG